MGFLDGKTAVVTGGSRGIGLAIAQALVNEEAEVLICGRDRASLERSASLLGPRAVAAACDVGHEQQVAELFRVVEQRFGGLDVLVNNAGVSFFGSVAELALEDWRTVIDTNLSGAFYCARLAIPLMKSRGGGYIINIGSLAGKNAFAGGAAYNASKFGLIGFSEALMLDVRYDNIRVSCVLPGSVSTDFSSSPARRAHKDWKLRSEDIAQTVLHLLRLPPQALASSIDMRPLMPPRK